MAYKYIRHNIRKITKVIYVIFVTMDMQTLYAVLRKYRATSYNVAITMENTIYRTCNNSLATHAALGDMRYNLVSKEVCLGFLTPNHKYRRSHTHT